MTNPAGSVSRGPLRSVVRSTWLVDGAITLAALCLTLVLLNHGVGPQGGHHRLDAATVILAAAATLPLLVWRRAPLAVFITTTLASALAYFIGFPPGPPVGPTVALYFLAASRSEAHPWTRRTTATVLALFCIHVSAEDLGSASFPIDAPLFGVLVWGVAWFAGERTRLRRVHITELKERALRAEREAEDRRRLATAEERTRIARDLHDSAGHALNVILVQAGASRLLHEQDPDRSRAALETIESVARQTVTEIDQLVHRLRESATGDGQVEGPPGLAGLDTLVARHAGAGLAITVNTVGNPTALPATLDQAAYRILQESLTNAARHGTGTASVELAFADAALDITTRNSVRADARSDRPNGGGQGLVGMRERAGVLGGSVRVEAADGLFCVHAHLPYVNEKAQRGQ